MSTHAWIDGRAATADELAALVAAGEGHFTTMQVRDGAVQGLPLHLERLADANRSLFNQGLDETSLRGALHAGWQADGRPASTLRASVHALRAASLDCPAPTLQLLVTTAAAAEPGTRALRVKSSSYCRRMPHVKHLGIFALLHQRRLAQAAGFDDALLVDPDGAVSEGSLWNIGFRTATGIVWPQAPALRGTRQRLLEAAFAAAGLAQEHRSVRIDAMDGFIGAFASNARGVQAIASIDDTTWPPDDAWDARLRAYVASAAWDPLAPVG